MTTTKSYDSYRLTDLEEPTDEMLAAIDGGEKLAHDPNAKTYSTPQELWDELGI